MFSREYRPLKRPRLGVPDFYPQDDKQKEDELNFHTLNVGYRLPLPVDTQDEFGTALKDFSQALLNTKEYSHRVNQVVDEKKKRRWVQDSERRRFQVTKDNFIPVPLGRNRKEIATQWFQELASNKPLSALAKKVPVFNKKEEIFDNLCEKDVPISRAAWYIKMAAAHNTTMTDVKLNKKKQTTDPSFDWTVSLTKYMQECVWRISNEPTSTPRPEGLSGGRHTSTSGNQNQAPSEDGMAEHVRWHYMVYLSSWLYQENLLDCHEFLRWLVERVEHIKLVETKTLQLYLPLVLKHLLDIGSCVVLARPLVKNCCQRLSVLFELEQKLAKIQVQPLLTPSSVSSMKPNPDIHTDSGSMEDDSVFDSSLVTVKQEPGVVVKTENSCNGGGCSSNATTKPPASGGSKKRSSVSSLSKDRKHTAGTPSTLGNGEVPIITMKVEEEETHVPISQTSLACDMVHVPGQSCHFHWCMHHQSLMLQLCSIIQTVSLCCPTAFVHTKVFVGRGVQGGKTTLSLLPMGLTELPMPRSLRLGLHKKLLLALASAEQEITMRNKAVDADWSAVTMADLQTNCEGSNVQQVLKILDILDTHSFVTSHPFNPLTTLYHRISTEQRGAEQPLTNDMLVMLLCQWAVTPCRSGMHRPLVTARILRQRQDQIMLRDASWKEERDKASMDETWEDFDQTNFSKMSDFPFPFQSVLIRFLDGRAPLPVDLNLPVKSSEPFYHLILLFFELIRLSVFSYTSYLSKLIARGEIKSTIIPYLQFAREEVEGLDDTSCRRPPPHDTEPLNLCFPLPTLKRPHLDTPGVSGGGDQSSSLDRGSQSSLMDIASGPPSPGGSFGTGMGNFMDILGVEDPTASSTSSSMFPPSGIEVGVSEMDESRALFHKRAQQLKLLASETSHLVEFSPPHTIPDPPDVTSSPINHHQTKGNFNFSLATIFTDEEQQSVDPTLNKHASRHLIFAAYFPISGWGFGKQERNERAVVLCGVGRIRRKVESIVKGISSDLEHYFRLLHGIQTPILLDSKLRKLMVRFQSLPTFEQHVVATSCEEILRSTLSRKTPYPACSQLVFVCELLEECGAIHQLFTLLVDIVACDFPPITNSKGEHRRVQAVPPCLPGELCLPMVWLLQKYLTCLLLSQHDTTVLFENLCRVLDGLQITEVSSCQKAVFLFLHLLYTKCSYLQTTFRSRFGHLCMQLGESTLVESYSPHATDMVDWQKMLTTKPSECNIPKLCATLKGTHHLKAFSSFAIDIFSTACQKNITCQTLCDLAHVCAGVSSVFGAKVNKELMGAFRALCMPSQAIKSCHSGYSALTSRTNVPMDHGVHSILISFVSLLMANHCFHLHDIIIYIIRPIIRLYISPEVGPGSTSSLEFVNTLILHLFVDDYRKGVGTSTVGKMDVSSVTVLPLFVQHCLEAKCQLLPLGYMLMLLKDLVRISVNRSGGTGTKSESLLIHSSNSGNDIVLGKLRSTMELLASQQWMQNKCSQQVMGRLLEADMLGDKYLTPPQARYLLLLLCPYTTSSTPGDIAHLAKNDAASVLADILKNLDQWTLKNSLLHINLSIAHTSGSSARSALLEELAAQVIRVFEDSCGDEWLGQTIECCVDGGDGSFSPSVWLVTPLISKLQESVLGRVLKSAGNVLGQGQWWNPEKSQEKRRATRASSGVATPKTGLQWQQPFLELVLACMHAQSTTHEELLAPLKSQLSNFLAAFDKEGMPGDEHGKAMLYAALKLRLSLVGSMLRSICVSESTCSTLDWLHLLMQFICSGAIDRQTDTSELFTNCLDMICTLLGSLSSEFHSSLAGGGEDGKKVHTSCIKKIKAELANSKSYCAPEIRQLFPLSPKTYSITTVKLPSSINLTKNNSSNERIKGLRVQDVKELSPWEILEGVKNSGPLMLSWFGAVRMKRKNLWLEEQRHLVRFHTHQDQAKNFISGPHTVKLPSKEQIPALPRPTEEILDATQGDATKQPSASGATPTSTGSHGGGVTGQGESMPMQPNLGGNQTSSRGGGAGRGGTMMVDSTISMGSSKATGGRDGGHSQMPPGVSYRLDGMSGSYRMPNRPINIEQVHPQQIRACLDHIKEQNMAHTGTGLHAMYSMPGGIGGGMMAAGRGAGPTMSSYRLQVLHQRHMAQQQKMQYMRMMQHHHQIQQQQQQQMINHQQQYGQFRGGPGHAPQMMHPAVAAQVQPMQANPPMPMQQVIQQQQQVAYAPGPQVTPGGHVGMMGAPPNEQPGMQQYPPQQAPPGLYM